MVIHLKSENNCCSLYMNKTFNGHTPNENSLLDLDRSDTHIHNVEAKRCGVDNDSATYLWHYRLGHIGVKRVKKLHKDGFSGSLGYESFDACEPCLLGKMTKTPFFRTMRRATNLLEIIHTDVCSPMSVEARDRYRYFATFTYELSKIWVCLLDET